MNSGAGRAPLCAVVLVLLAVGGCATAEIEAVFAPSANPDERWARHDPASTETVDHGAWDRLLATYLATDAAGVNRFAYGRVTAADRQALETYIDSLEAVEVSRLGRDEQFVYWVNLYNAATVRTILENAPVASIRDIADGPLSTGPWDRLVVTVEGRRLSLNDIEHRILRPVWRDPRIHYVVNCAAVGCPNLRGSAYLAAGLDESLDQAARAYVNDPRGVTIAPDGHVVASSIYAWFRNDFGGSEAAVLRHLRAHAEPRLADRLSRARGVDGYEYDWSLNGR